MRTASGERRAGAEGSEIWLGVHDASRLEWVAEIPLPRRGAEEIELELATEVPVNIWAAHDHWEHLQLLARLSSPADEKPAAEAPPATADELRRATLAAVHRFKEAREGIERELFQAGSLFSQASAEEIAGRIRERTVAAIAEIARERARLCRTGAEAGELARERDLAAEFLSNHVLEGLSRLGTAVDQRLRAPEDPQRSVHEAAAESLRPFLAGCLAEELAFRASRGYVQPDDGDPWTLERFVTRASLLKKHFQEVLFLEMETERSDVRFRNFFGAVAAILAALWAFPLALLLDGKAGAGLGLGLSSTLGLLVASYAVKDRIKETVRNWLAQQVATSFAGRLTTLDVPERLLGAPVRLARIRESFFTTREQRPDPLNPELGPSRQVLRLRYLFRGEIAGDSRLAVRGHERMKVVFRYDLSPLFTRLDDPFKRVPVLAADGRTMRFADAARCYRLPVRVQLRYGGATEEQTGLLVLHKLGLERIEAAPADEEPAPETAPVASIAWPTLRR